MNCPKCQTENPETRKFCRKCGAKLILACPKCGFENLPDDMFCGECGQALSLPQESIPEKQIPGKRPFQPAPPKELTEKILAQKGRIEGERRQVTVMFCDLEGSTALTESLGDEKAFSLIDEIFDILTQQVHRFEGTVQEFRGDGIMALFGAPIALENAAQRAISTSLAIHREVTRFNNRVREESRGPAIRMRIGIHTGPVILGGIGSDLRLEFQVIGDTVNLASRMEGLAEPGSTCVTEDTFKLTEGLFRFEGLGEKAIKGKEKPIRIYRVIAPSSSRTRFDVSAERGLTPFVGRERERELLLDAFERARSGRGQAVSIASEAGLGKSRLLYEFRKTVLNEDITFLEGKCLSFSRGVAYQPIADILKSNFDIRDGDLDFAIRNKVKQGLKVIGVEEGPVMPYLLEILSVKDSGIEKIAISPEDKKDKTIETLKKIVLKGSEARPLVMAIEDLHWIDRTSEDALKYLLETIPGAKILLIFTYRPEFIPTWGARSYHNQLLLNRLSNRESLLMVNYLLGTEDIESALEEVILEKTEGIPFFIEEFLKSLKDLGFIERKDATYRIAKELQSARIPSTIQDIIMARVDALPEGAKEVLQVGSLIEREFSFKIIEAVMKLSERDLLHHLSVLKDAELLYERGLFPDSTLIFKHALTREVVSDTLLARKKKEIHTEIAQAMEEVYKDALEEQFGSLAEHFKEAGDYAKAAYYYRRSVGKALRASALLEAIPNARNVISCLEKLPITENIQKQIIDWRVNLAGICSGLSHNAEAKDAVAPIIDLAQELNYRKPAIYVILAGYLLLVEEKHNEEEYCRYLEEAKSLSLEEKDFMSLWAAYSLEAIKHAWNCEFTEGESYFTRVIEQYQATRDVSRIAINKSVLVNTIYSDAGRIDEALRTSLEALQLANETDLPTAKAGAYVAYGTALFHKGILLEAEQNLILGLELNQKTDAGGFIIPAFFYLGILYFLVGRYDEALECFNGLLTLYERVRTLPSVTLFAQIWKVATGILSNLDSSIDEVRNFDVNGVVPRFQGITAQGMGEIFLNIDDDHMNEAEAWIKKAIELHERYEMPWYLAIDYVSYAKFFKKKGDPSQAKENLHKAVDLMRSIGADGWVKKYEEELAGLG